MVMIRSFRTFPLLHRSQVTVVTYGMRALISSIPSTNNTYLSIVWRIICILPRSMSGAFCSGTKYSLGSSALKYTITSVESRDNSVSFPRNPWRVRYPYGSKLNVGFSPVYFRLMVAKGVLWYSQVALNSVSVSVSFVNPRCSANSQRICFSSS